MYEISVTSPVDGGLLRQFAVNSIRSRMKCSIRFRKNTCRESRPAETRELDLLSLHRVAKPNGARFAEMLRRYDVVKLLAIDLGAIKTIHNDKLLFDAA